MGIFCSSSLFLSPDGHRRGALSDPLALALFGAASHHPRPSSRPVHPNASLISVFISFSGWPFLPMPTTMTWATEPQAVPCS